MLMSVADATYHVWLSLNRFPKYVVIALSDIDGGSFVYLCSKCVDIQHFGMVINFSCDIHFRCCCWNSSSEVSVI